MHPLFRFPVFGTGCTQRHRSPLLPSESRPRFQAETDSGLNRQAHRIVEVVSVVAVYSITVYS